MPRNRNANSGGAANHAGVGYQDRVAAWLCVRILLEQEASALWDWPANAVLENIRCNSKYPVDDIFIASSHGDNAFINVKHTVTASQLASSELASVLKQFTEQFIANKASIQSQSAGISQTQARFVLIAKSASQPIQRDLKQALVRISALSPEQDILDAAESEAERTILRTCKSHLNSAWRQLAGRLPNEQELIGLLGLMRIEILDVDQSGNQEREAKDLLASSLLKDASQADLAWDVLVQTCHEWAAQRSGGSRANLQQRLLQRGIEIKTPRSFRSDVERLQEHSELTFRLLSSFSRIRLATREIKIRRPASQALREAIENHSVVVVGEPGSGKSGVLHELVESLKQETRDVVFLAVDKLEAQSLQGLQQELGLEHRFDQVLQNWTSTQSGFLVIDALDAARSADAAKTFYDLLALLLSEPSRWKVIASIRQYDLRYNTKLKALFRGQPPTAFYSNEFAFLKHLTVPKLAADEWQQISAQAPELSSLFIEADPKLRELLLVPFNIKLMAELLGRGLAPERLTPIKTQIELLGLYWEERVCDPIEERDAREILLTQAVEAMVESRSLRADRRRVFAANFDGPVLAQLLSANILSEWQSTTDCHVNDAVLTFAHHVLFDYAVARLLLRGSSSRLVELLEANPELVMAIRPSIVMHFERERWQDLKRCWENIFSLIHSEKVPEIGKMIGPSVLVGSATSIEDFAPLVEAVTSSQPAQREAAEKALRHIICALTVKSENVHFIAGPNALNWAELLERLTDAGGSTVIFAVRPVLHLLCNQPERLNEDQRAFAGRVARRVFEHALIQDPRNSVLVISGLQLVCRTYESDVNASSSVLHRCLGPNHVLQHGHEELFRFAQEVERLITIDPQFVEDVYRAAFTVMDESNERTSMGGSRIMRMSSTRRQDFQAARYSLAGKYGAFIKQAPTNALRVLIASLDAYHNERYSYWKTATKNEETFDFAGQTARLKADGSEVWANENGFGSHEEPLKMLYIFVEYFNQLCNDAEKISERKNLLHVIVAENSVAAIWRILLQTATKYPQTLGLDVCPLAWALPILSFDDTSQPVGEYLKSVFPYLTTEEKTRIEQAILSLSKLANEEDREFVERRRNRLLGCLAEDLIVTEDARILLKQIQEADNVPPNEPRFHPPVISSHPFTITDSLRMHGVPVEKDTHQRLLILLEPVRQFADGFRNASPTLIQAREIMSALRALWAALQDPNTESCHEQTLDLAWSYLASACAAIAKSKESDSEQSEITFIRAVLIKAAEHPSPSPEANQSLDEHAAWGSPSARIEAAEGLICLASKPTCSDDELLLLIERLATDPAWPVRFKIATRLVSLYHVAPELMWRLLEKVSRTEDNKAILHFFTASSLNQLAGYYPDRIAEMTRNIFDRVCTDEKAKETRGKCTDIFTGLYLWQDQQLCSETVSVIVEAPAYYEIEAKNMAFHLRSQLNLGAIESANAEEEQVRRRAFDLLSRLLSTTLQQTKELVARYSGVTFDQWSEADKEKASRLAHLADSIGMQIYFASGAYQESEPVDELKILREVPERTRFWNEARPLLEMLAEFGYAHLVHQLVETLEFLLPFAPEEVFLLLGKVVRKGQEDGYQYESMAIEVIVRIVERMMAEYRYILQQKEASRNALIEILDIFVEACWPAATRLTYRLEEIFR